MNERFPIMAEQVEPSLYRTDWPEYERQRNLHWRNSQPTPETVHLYSGSIPWEMAERAYKVYSQKYGTSQSLVRLAQRGGFSHGELRAFGLTAAEVCAGLESHAWKG